jgi:hypothetical protein
VSSSSGGSGLGTLAFVVTIVFVVLKWTGYLAWSWLWILSPIWIVLGLGLVYAVVYILGAFLGYLAVSRAIGKGK